MAVRRQDTSQRYTALRRRLEGQERLRSEESEMHTALFVFLGGLLAALAVGLGAIGAHALKTQLTPE